MNAAEHILTGGARVAGLERAALLCGDERLTFGDLMARVGQFAGALHAGGLRPGDKVAIVMLDSPDMVALHLATVSAGAVAVALSTRMTADDLQLTLAVARPFAVVVDEEFADSVSKAIAAAAPQAKLILRHKDLAAWKQRPETGLAAAPMRPDDPAFWLMTSGTTGQPKAVEHRHSNVLICSDYFVHVLGVTAADRFLSTSRLNFGYPLAALFGGLRIGATIILMERWPTAHSTAAAVNRYAPTILFSVPAMYHQMLLEAPYMETAGFRTVRHYISSGERLPAKLSTVWEEKFGRRLLNTVGTSELTYYFIGDTPAHDRPGASGQSLPGADVRLVDDEGKVVTEPGQDGHLEVRMASLCRGYRLPGAEAGVPAERPADRFKEDGWFATGDQFMRDGDGYYFHLGRADDMIKIAGLWLSPFEIEDALTGIPSIAQAAAVARDNEAGLAEIVLYIVPAPDFDGPAAIAAARERLRTVLPAFKRPRRFEIVADVPRTATGKMQRRKLRENDYLAQSQIEK